MRFLGMARVRVRKRTCCVGTGTGTGMGYIFEKIKFGKSTGTESF